jgi:hypothetical protein
MLLAGIAILVRMGSMSQPWKQRTSRDWNLSFSGVHGASHIDTYTTTTTTGHDIVHGAETPYHLVALGALVAAACTRRRASIAVAAIALGAIIAALFAGLTLDLNIFGDKIATLPWGVVADLAELTAIIAAVAVLVLRTQTRRVGYAGE